MTTPYRPPFPTHCSASSHQPDDLPLGSGSGPFRRGEPITHPAQVRPGDLLIEDCPQFSATNLVCVLDKPTGWLGLGWGRDYFYAAFRDPADVSKARLGSHGLFCVWAAALTHTHFYRALAPIPAPLP